MNSYITLFFSTISFGIIITAGWYTYKKNSASHHHNMAADALSTGIFLGMALMHMLPESNSGFNDIGFQYPIAYFIMSLTFLLFLWIEHWAGELYHHKKSITFTLIAWLMLSIHSFFMGISLGLANSSALAWMLFIGIISHKWAEGFSIAQQINKVKLKQISKYILFISYALFTPLGILIGKNLHNHHQQFDLMEPLILAFSSGIFLYLGTLHGLERCIMLRACCNLKDYSLVILGFLIMSVQSS